MTASQVSWKAGIDYPVLPLNYLNFKDYTEVPTNDPKYIGYEGLIYNRITGVPIPKWEPTMTFRAKDKHALEVVGVYCTILEGAYELAKARFGALSIQAQQAAHHLHAVQKRRAEFARFQEHHPELMQEPTTDLLPG